MKQFIVLVVTLPLMLFLMAEFTLNEANSQKIYLANQYVYSAKETAKQEGCFDNENIEKLKQNIASVCNIDKDSVTIVADGEGNRKYRDSEGSAESRYIYYEVSFPIEKSLSLLRRSDKVYVCKIKGYTPSEYVGGNNK